MAIPFASLLLGLLTLLVSCLAAITVLIALFRGHFVCVLGLVLALGISWLLSPWFAARKAFLFGLSARLHQSSSAAELLSAADMCVSLMPDGGRAIGPKKGLRPRPEDAERSKRVWDAIAKYPFVHLGGDRCVVFVQPPEVTFEWGGALAGHWGATVYGSYDAATAPKTTRFLRFSDKIFLFSASD